MGKNKKTEIALSEEAIYSQIYVIRKHKVMLSFHLAALYEVEVRVLNQAVKRNLERFPEDFMFQLTQKEWASLRSQFVTLDGRGKYPKYRSAPRSTATKKDVVKDITFTRKPVAELSGAVVFEITLDNGALPDSRQRKEISKYIRDLHFENVCIFVDKDRSQSIWHWGKKQDKKMMPRDHFYMRGQPGDLFIAKLSSLVFDISDFDKDGNVPIAEVAGRMPLWM